MKDEVTISKKEFEDLIRDVVTDVASDIAVEIGQTEGLMLTAFGVVVAHKMADVLFNDDLEVKE